MQHLTPNRRQLLCASSAFLASAAFPISGASAKIANVENLTLGYSTYALPKSTTEESCQLISGIGYDTIELTVTADRPVAPEKMDAPETDRVRRLLADHKLELTALMENLRPLESLERHDKDCKRLARAAELANSLSPGKPPIIQTVLGNGDWMKVRDLCSKRLEDWARIGEKEKVVIGIKPHRGGAMSRPAEAVWLLQQLGDNPWVRMVYDYSHFIFRDMPLAETISTALPYTCHIAVKDAAMNAGNIAFTLPGQSGTIDYKALLQQFYAGGYRGDICVEVSSQVWNKPGYDSADAAKKCYAHMSQAFRAAGIRRPAL
jgi:sugar phosphate isomerase/epimerase